MDSIRSIIKRRDNLDDVEINMMFQEFRTLFAGGEGEDPEELLSDIFGLEPDYIFDPELGVM